MTVSKSLSKTLLGLFFGLLGVVLLFKEVIAAFPSPVAWADITDSPLIYWTVNWGYHAIFELKQPLAFWNANSFYPHLLTLAYSDSILSIQIFFAPLRFLGVNPLFALYLSLAGTCLLGFGLTLYGLSRLKTFSTAEMIFIAYAAHFSLSMVSFSYHYQLFGFQLALAFFIFFYLYIRDYQLRDLIITLLAYGTGVLFAIYLAPMLLTIALISGVPFILFTVLQKKPLTFIRKIGIRGPLMAAGSALLLYAFQFKPYFEVENGFPKQPLRDKIAYSANLNSLISGISPFSKWYGSIAKQVYGSWEYEYFPGMILLGLSSLFLLVFIVYLIRQKKFPTEKIDLKFWFYLSLVLVSAIILSWGPLYKLDHTIKLPYYYLSKLIFGLGSIRAPGRFGMFIGLPLAVFSIFALRLIITDSLKRQIAVSIILLLLVIESLTIFPTYQFTVDPDGVYARVSQEIDWGTPLLELPVYGKDNLDTIRIATDQLKGSTIHWGKLVSGYGSKTTGEYQDLLYLDNMVQNENHSPQAIIDFANQYQIQYLLIDLNAYNLRVRKNWEHVLQETKAATIFKVGNVWLIRLPQD